MDAEFPVGAAADGVDGARGVSNEGRHVPAGLPFESAGEYRDLQVGQPFGMKGIFRPFVGQATIPARRELSSQEQAEFYGDNGCGNKGADEGDSRNEADVTLVCERCRKPMDPACEINGALDFVDDTRSEKFTCAQAYHNASGKARLEHAGTFDSDKHDDCGGDEACEQHRVQVAHRGDDAYEHQKAAGCYGAASFGRVLDERQAACAEDAGQKDREEFGLAERREVGPS